MKVDLALYTLKEDAKAELKRYAVVKLRYFSFVLCYPCHLLFIVCTYVSLYAYNVYTQNIGSA
jgi:hypothetical protein